MLSMVEAMKAAELNAGISTLTIGCVMLLTKFSFIVWLEIFGCMLFKKQLVITAAVF
jgi:hypothetical protein